MSIVTDSHEGVTAAWATDILDFWFKEVGPDGWWEHDPALDGTCAARFGDLWAEKRHGAADDFLNRADEGLAAILLFDQMPRNMFRGTARAYATDPLAREIARGAVARGYDVQIGGSGRLFFYMPFQHSEAMEDQEAAIAFFQTLGDQQALRFAREHYAVIARFGRFPHRNAVLGRTTLPQEEAAAAEGAGW
jgi:uncharacterized protein (DUF924 family)